MRLTGTGITKSWGATHVLRGVGLDCAPGQVIALTGANGAGKTTLIRILATLTKPDNGTFQLGELDAAKHTLRYRALVGFLGHESMLDASLTARENLHLFGRLYGVNNVKSRADALIERFECAPFADSSVHELSRGQEQRAGLCRALMHSPKLLLLDEPSTGLDTDARRRLWQTAREHALPGNIVIFSTHDHQSAEKTPDTVWVLNNGKIVQG